MENFNLTEFAKTNDIIFYCAGIYAKNTLGYFTAHGIVPVCYADKDPFKHGKKIGGKYEIFSIKDAFLRFPNAYVLVTIEPVNQKTIINTLIESGAVEAERILNLKFEKFRSCDATGSSIIVSGKALGLCCHNRFDTADYKAFDPTDIDGSVRDFLRFNADTAERILNGNEEKLCKDCPMIDEFNVVKLDDKINYIYLAGSLPCNIRCKYCYRDYESNKYSVEIIKALEAQNAVSKGAVLTIAGGEIAVNPQREAILELAQNYSTLIFTNGVKYNEGVSKIISRDNGFAIVSIDAGTKDGYIKIKEVDAFENVAANLKRYKAEGGHFAVKYIMCLGINDNTTEVDGFIRFCEDVQPENVMLGVNFYDEKAAFCENSMKLLTRIRQGSEDAGIPVVWQVGLAFETKSW